VSVGGVSEHTYNSNLAKQVLEHLSEWGIPCFIVDRYEGNGYTAAMKWLASYLKSRGATVAVELHFNMTDNSSASGNEWLFWASSESGRRLAKALDESMSETFPDAVRRGIKPKGHGDRGAEFLKLTYCPAVICEPFFGSNPGDWEEIAVRRQSNLALVVATGIRDYLAS
jgi:N-acetylmuramoyl-L-alanine amidase